MFKDVISTGWLRIHIIIIVILPIIGGVLVLLGGDEEVFYGSIWLSISYIIMLRAIVWVKRGFKKS